MMLRSEERHHERRPAVLIYLHAARALPRRVTCQQRDYSWGSELMTTIEQIGGVFNLAFQRKRTRWPKTGREWTATRRVSLPTGLRRAGAVLQPDPQLLTISQAASSPLSSISVREIFPVPGESDRGKSRRAARAT